MLPNGPHEAGRSPAGKHGRLVSSVGGVSLPPTYLSKVVSTPLDLLARIGSGTIFRLHLFGDRDKECQACDMVFEIVLRASTVWDTTFSRRTVRSGEIHESADPQLRFS